MEVLETKLENNDVENIKITGYVFLSKTRKKFRGGSGGVGVFIKQIFIEKNCL